MSKIIFGAATHKGQIRTTNQDAFYAALHPFPDNPSEQFGMFMVADGAGAEADGEKAARLAVEVTAQFLQEHLLSTTTSDECANLLKQAFTLANVAVVHQVPEGGSTLTVALIVKSEVIIGHVGVSRIYLTTPQSIKQLSKDHDFFSVLVETGHLTIEALDTAIGKNLVFNTLGMKQLHKIDMIVLEIKGDEQILLCSDGVWSLLGIEKVHEVIWQHPTPQTACEQLIQLAREKNDFDDTTAIMVKLTGF